jgi:hypothetical protein
MVSRTSDSAFDCYQESQRGWGKVLVLAEDKEAAETVINEYLASLEMEEKKSKKRRKSDGDQE